MGQGEPREELWVEVNAIDAQVGAIVTRSFSRNMMDTTHWVVFTEHREPGRQRRVRESAAAKVAPTA